MKTALLIASSKTDRNQAVVISGPLPYDQVLAEFKSHVGTGSLPAKAVKNGCNVLEVWDRKSGCRKSHTFREVVAEPIAPAKLKGKSAKGAAKGGETPPPAPDPVDSAEEIEPAPGF